MGNKDLQNLKRYDEFITHAKRRGGTIRNGGPHTVITGPTGGIVSMPRVNGEFTKGMRCKLRRLFVLIGLGLMPLMCLISAMIAG